MGAEATVSGEALFDLTSTLTSSDSTRAGQTVRGISSYFCI